MTAVCIPGEDSESVPGFRRWLADYIRIQALPVDKFGHQPRLYHLTKLVGEGHLYDDEVVYAAVWLHDLGVFLGHRPEDAGSLARWDNTAYAMEQAPNVLAPAGFPTEKIAAVVEVIRTHQADRRPATLEGLIVHDADILEQLGSVGVLRAAAKIGRDTRYPTFTGAVEVMHKNLVELPGKLSLETAKILARPRIALLQAFLDELDHESQGGLF